MRVVVSTQWLVVTADNHQILDTGLPQARLQIGTDEGRVDVLDDHRLAGLLARLILDRIARLIGAKARAGLERGVAHMKIGARLARKCASCSAMRLIASGLLRRWPSASQASRLFARR